MKVVSIAHTHNESEVSLPLYTASISAGFPSPAENHIDKKIDLNVELIKHPAATFFVRVEGDSMIGAGIQSNDILIVDRSIEPRSGKIVVAIVSGEFTVKKLIKKDENLFLVPENPKYPTLLITKEMEFSIWGVVTYAIHSL